MKIIIIDNDVYSVKNEVYRQLAERQEIAEFGEKYHDRSMAQMDLDWYIRNQKENWKLLGQVDFHFAL